MTNVAFRYINDGSLPEGITVSDDAAAAGTCEHWSLFSADAKCSDDPLAISDGSSTILLEQPSRPVKHWTSLTYANWPRWWQLVDDRYHLTAAFESK
jgi:hypothetical protein